MLPPMYRRTFPKGELNLWAPLPTALAPVSRARGVAIGAACGCGAALVLAVPAGVLFEGGGATGLLAAVPVAAAMGAALGWVATAGWARRWVLWIVGVFAAFATAPSTGLAMDLMIRLVGRTPPPSEFEDQPPSWFGMALFGMVILSPGILIAGIVAGEAVWRATRRRA